MTRERLVHVVDDDEAVRKSVSFLLAAAGFKVRLWSSGGALLDRIDLGRPSCILLDVRMPPPDGLAVQRELTRRDGRVPVIVFTGHGDIAIMIQAWRAGAIDVIEKPFERHVLLAAIGSAFHHLEDPEAADDHRDTAARALAALDARERLVLDRLAAGWTNDRIARHLHVSLRTVEVRRAGVLAKLRVPTLAAALRIAFRAGNDRR